MNKGVLAGLIVGMVLGQLIGIFLIAPKPEPKKESDIPQPGFIKVERNRASEQGSLEEAKKSADYHSENEEKTREVVEWMIQEEKKVQKLIKESTVEELIQNIKSSDDIVLRLRSMKALLVLKDKRAIEPLIELLKDEDWQIRESAAYTLGFMKDKSAVPHLIELLKDKDDNVKRHACAALITLTGKSLREDYNEWKEWHEQQENN